MMDKLLCVFGTGFIVLVIKLKEWLEGVAELVKGAEGFALVLGGCVTILLAVILLMSIGRSKDVRPE